MSSKYIFDYAYLAEASYTDFSKDEEAYFSLKDPDNGGKSESFAELVTQNYTVEAHWKDEGTLSNDKSGFSGTLFKGQGTTENGGNTASVGWVSPQNKVKLGQ